MYRFFICLAFAVTTCSGSAFAQPPTSRSDSPGYTLEPVDATKLAELSPAQFAAQIKECSATALLIKEASKSLEAAHDGSPESATKIALVKLKLLERIAKTLPLATRELERFRHRALIEETRQETDAEDLNLQIAQLNQEIDELSKQVKEVEGELTGDDATIALLAMKIERLDEMQVDQKASQRTHESIQATLNTLSTLETRIATYRDLTREEVKRQLDAIRRSRVSRNSALLNSEAEFLFSTVQSLEIPVSALPRNTPGLVVPDTASVSLAKPASSITPELRSKVLARVRGSATTLATTSTDSKSAEVKHASATSRK